MAIQRAGRESRTTRAIDETPPRHRALKVAALMIAAVIGFGTSGPARADEPSEPANVAMSSPDSSKVEILVTPYVWLPWTSVSADPANPRIENQSVTISAGKLVSHLTWIPFMGEAEFRKGRFGAVADYIHAPLTSGFSTRGILFGGGRGGLTLDVGTAMFFYRPVSGPAQYLDVGAGVRAWGVDTMVMLNQRLLPNVTLSNGSVWADPLIGARYHREFGNGWGATAYGDIGGFGAGAKLDAQARVSIDYKPRRWPTLHAGFRDVSYDKSSGLARFNVDMYGPFLAATFGF